MTTSTTRMPWSRAWEGELSLSSAPLDTCVETHITMRGRAPGEDGGHGSGFEGGGTGCGTTREPPPRPRLSRCR